MLNQTHLPLLGFAAYSGTGKTTLLVKLLPLLKNAGLRVGMIKHAHHQFDIDQPGKDSYLLRKAGAVQMLVASSQRWTLMTEHAETVEPDLAELLTHLNPQQLDLVLVEGFKFERFPKIELHRAALDHPLLYPQDSSIIAIATDYPLPSTLPAMTRLDIDDEQSICNFILTYLATLNE